MISIAEEEVKGDTPYDKLNAMKIAKQISESEISRFINGETIDIKEKLTSIRVVNNNEIIKDEDVYEEFIKNRSSGVIRGIQNIRWLQNKIYYVASLYKIN